MPLGGTNQKEDAPTLRVPRANVLLVEGDPRDLQYHFVILEAFGYRVRVCRSFQEGVLRLWEDVFDFVLVSQGTP